MGSVPSFDSARNTFNGFQGFSAESKLGTDPDRVQREIEAGPLVDSPFGPDAATVALDDSPYRGQANARAFVLLRAVQSLENFEEPSGARRIETGPIVAHEIDRLSSPWDASELDVRFGCPR